jgi:hypothetical protein
LRKSRSRRDHVNKIGAIVCGNAAVTKARCDDPRGLRAQLRIPRINWIAIRPKQAIEFKRK